MFKGLFRDVSDAAERAARVNVAFFASAIIVFSLFAIAHMTSLAYPPVDGKAHKVTRAVAGVCLLGVVATLLWCVVAIQR